MFHFGNFVPEFWTHDTLDMKKTKLENVKTKKKNNSERKKMTKKFLNLIIFFQLFVNVTELISILEFYMWPKK